jgi:hypothetical protein
MKCNYAYWRIPVRSYNFFNRRTTRKKYERMRRIARFWSVYPCSDDDSPPDFYSEFWDWFSPARPYPAEPLKVRLSEFSGAKDIPF